MMSIKRRDFIKTTASALAAGGYAAMSSAQSAASKGQVVGANDAINVGFIGLGGRGGHTVNWFSGIPGVRIAGLCDVDSSHVERTAQKIGEKHPNVKTFIDAREMLADKDIDAVAISTCNHWHALLTIWACQAGKDVYVEKPASHNIYEGRKMVEAARKYKRIVQTGTQNRSDTGCRPAMEYIHAGKLGAIKLVRGFCHRKRGGIGKVSGPQPIPETCDYNLWCGPAPMAPLTRKNLHYDWHWVWATGNGDIGNQGPHETDLGRWALNTNELPARVISIGGRYVWDDDGETANTQIAFFDYKPAPFIFEVRNLTMSKESGTMDHFKGIRVGIIVECEDGYFAGGRNGGWIYDNDGKRVQQFKGDGGGGHALNFIEAMRTRDVDHLNADIAEGHLSAALAHMANTSVRLGQGKSPDEIRDKIKGDAQFVDAFDRMADHLAKHDFDVAKTPVALGPMLEFDSKAERYSGGPDAAKANAMLTRDYRKPFVVPENV